MHTEHSLAEAKAIRAATSWSTSRIQHNWNQRGLSAGARVGACYADPRLCAHPKVPQRAHSAISPDRIGSHRADPDDLVWDLFGQVFFELLFPLSDDVSRWRRPEGEPVCGAHHAVRCDLVFGGSVQNPNHDAGIRIDDQAPGAAGPLWKAVQRPCHRPGCRHLRNVRMVGWSVLVARPAGYRAAVGTASRSRTPSGISPVLTIRHRAISSLRASATIIAMRVLPRPSAVRSRYHRTRALSF